MTVSSRFDGLLAADSRISTAIAMCGRCEVSNQTKTQVGHPRLPWPMFWVLPPIELVAVKVNEAPDTLLSCLVQAARLKSNTVWAYLSLWHACATESMQEKYMSGTYGFDREAATNLGHPRARYTLSALVCGCIIFGRNTHETNNDDGSLSCSCTPTPPSPWAGLHCTGTYLPYALLHESREPQAHHRNCKTWKHHVLRRSASN